MRSNLETKRRELIEAFEARKMLMLDGLMRTFNPRYEEQGCDTPDGACGYCVDASNDFAILLDQHGLPTRVVSLRCYRGPSLPRLHSEWRRATLCHSVVQVGDDMFVDWTARQFDSDSPFPKLYTLGELKRDWERIESLHGESKTWKAATKKCGGRTKAERGLA